MDTQHTQGVAADRGAVVVVGGNGGLSAKYREVVAAHGAALRHYERRVPKAAGRGMGHRIALVVVMVGMVSHPLREQAQELAARDHVPILYLRSPSISALRQALQGALLPGR